MNDNIVFSRRRWSWAYDPSDRPFYSRDRTKVEQRRNAILAERRRIAGRELTKEETKDGWNPRIIELRRAAEAEMQQIEAEHQEFLRELRESNSEF